MEGETPKMRYVTLGRSGLKVSKLSYGNWVNCKDNAQEKANALVKKAWELGVNFFDTAEVYNSGEAERQIGVAIKKLNVPRSDYVVSTKIYWGKFSQNTNKHNNVGTSRKRLIEGLNRSLENLQMEYVDIVFCHRYDNHTPTIEVVQTMKHLIETGKAFYWGTSTWPATRVMEAMLLCDIVGCPRPIAEQCQYSMLYREKVEQEYNDLFDDYNLATTIWSPLKYGILTGKYNNGIPEGSRFSSGGFDDTFEEFFADDKKEGTLKMLNSLAEVAKRLDCSMVQLALAWTIGCKDVTTVLLGASRPEQLEQNVGALEVFDKLTPEIFEEIEGILGNRPELARDYRDGGKLPKRR